MSLEKVRLFFRQYSMEDRIREFDCSSATVELAAKALDCEEARIAKTLSFILRDGKCVLIVTSGDARIDNRKFKEVFGCKAVMPGIQEAGALTGHQVGGICPFAVNDGIGIYLDVSLKRFETVFPACGSSNSAIELSIAELEKYSGYLNWIDVCNINSDQS